MEELKTIKPEEVVDKIPARLVVGMGSCQLSRIQSWLENMLTPFSKEYGAFEYTKDTSTILECIQDTNDKIIQEHWDLNKAILFSIDVKALYPSVKLEYLKKALTESFKEWTDWSHTNITILVNIIMYTLENQQIYWNGDFYKLNQGIPTGAKHCVPLANILLTFIIRELMKEDEMFASMVKENIKIWKRFIDDVLGMFLGRERAFKNYLKKLVNKFKKYGLELTSEQSRDKIVTLDLEIYKQNNILHTREHRKETAANVYLRYTSAHPKFTFKGIVRSQMYRLRRLCSKDDDFRAAIENLKVRCSNAGYDKEMVDEILAEAGDLKRELRGKQIRRDDMFKIRWVTLAHSKSEKEIESFVENVNNVLRNNSVAFEVIKTTAPTIGKQLFNNNNSGTDAVADCSSRCKVCGLNARGDVGTAVSSETGESYRIDSGMKCTNSGIYLITCKCKEQYSGKTTVTTGKRFSEHLRKDTSMKDHLNKCRSHPTEDDVKIQFVENVWNRGKYTLSEREYLWNRRMKGSINVQKTLKAL